jgi:Spy/CpxP family protein refolding chaperone
VPAPEQHHGRNSNHPIVEMVFAELPQVGLSAEQKTTVDSLDAELRKQADLIDAPKKQLETDFVDGVSAGKLDKVKVDADVKKLVQAADATVVAMQEAMTKLHKTLDVAQRKKLIEILRAKTEEHHGHPVGAKAEEHREHEKGERDPAEKLAAELGLNADQREKLTTKLGAELKAEKATMKEHLAAMQKRMKIMYDAFESDKFDAKKAGVGEHVGEMVKRMATSRVRFVEAVLSVLTPEQRGKFAEHMRNRDEH